MPSQILNISKNDYIRQNINHHLLLPSTSNHHHLHTTTKISYHHPVEGKKPALVIAMLSSLQPRSCWLSVDNLDKIKKQQWRKFLIKTIPRWWIDEISFIRLRRRFSELDGNHDMTLFNTFELKMVLEQLYLGPNYPSEGTKRPIQARSL